MSILEGFPPPDLNKKIQELIKSGVVLQAQPSYGMGGRITSICTIEHEHTKWVIELFAELLVRKPPKDTRAGYSVEEIEHNHGVFVSRVVGKSKTGERLNGLYLSAADFEKYLTDGAVRVLLYRYLEDFKSRIKADEDDAERYSSAYQNRPIGLDLFARRKILC